MTGRPPPPTPALDTALEDNQRLRNDLARALRGVRSLERQRSELRDWIEDLEAERDRLRAALDDAIESCGRLSRAADAHSAERSVMRLAIMGACATLDRAAEMSVPHAAEMRDRFRALLAGNLEALVEVVESNPDKFKRFDVDEATRRALDDTSIVVVDGAPRPTKASP